MSGKKIDIVIPTYNGAGHIARLLESVKAQTLDDYECFVVDDNSEDSTADIVSDRFPWVTLLRQPRNRGPSANRNRAVTAGAIPPLLK